MNIVWFYGHHAQLCLQNNF